MISRLISVIYFINVVMKTMFSASTICCYVTIEHFWSMLLGYNDQEIEENKYSFNQFTLKSLFIVLLIIEKHLLRQN
jgi:hypothetical protein